MFVLGLIPFSFSVFVGQPYEAKKSRDVVIDSFHTALDRGINCIDTALTNQYLYRFMKRVEPESLETSNPHQIALDFVLSNPDVPLPYVICGPLEKYWIMLVLLWMKKNGAGILCLTAFKKGLFVLGYPRLPLLLLN
ncbi:MULTISPECIES: hypothetical protein [unclassified Paenibacillus]|uniref:hypothetical protein n=1 Tax=unclassified Paenibacillus TaxID=185978 RepID=UPI00278B7A46|nr:MULTISPECIES: hypothetical protein [unclassified Paenibacillus]MDQ0902016.1 aryl-alcohol dehydrogenase-like predicted oxidoreductase [Paenibacillus sp. V4I7]MDQ0919488.1 aryl-alcohol dehydrogenase-like predicted oxidoreductase [Paenibacillus sp. V4I5]